MTALLIEAADTLFFRDGRPFTMGEDVHASGLFPPPPSVVYGALRSAFMADKMPQSDLEQLIEVSSDLTINQLWLNMGDNIPHFALPKDLVVPKDKKEAFFLKPIQRPPYSSAITPEVLLNEQEGKMKEGDFWLHQSQLRDYLNKIEQSFTYKELPTLAENKIGIGRQNETHIATDGLLYRAQMHRLKNEQNQTVNIGVEFSNLDVDTEGVLQLGGERKVAFKKAATVVPRFDLPILENNRFKIYLATPAIFKTGWQPRDLFQKLGASLITAAIGKPIYVGGWDLEQRRPKPMLQAVPAGSVYYVEAPTIEHAQNAAQTLFNQQSISDISAQQGFGIAYIGKV